MSADIQYSSTGTSNFVYHSCSNQLFTSNPELHEVFMYTQGSLVVNTTGPIA